MNKTLRTLAAQYDVVIVGRGGSAGLEGYADVYNVLITAPEDVRIERTVADDGLTEEGARKKVERDTRSKTRFVRRYYGKNWADESRYDLVIDTSETPNDEAVARIVEASRTHLAAGEGPRASDLDVDPVLLETIEQRFAR